MIAGSGPLLLAVAKYMRDHGADLRLVAEQANAAALLRFGMELARHPGKLLQAVQLRAGLLRTRYLTSCWPIAADGGSQLESVTLYHAGKTWREPCDYLACGFGLVPNVELPALLGCRLGASGVEVDDYQQTSVAGVYCAGEVTGIGGLDLSLVEGEIAGYAAAGKPESARPLFAAREQHRRFAAALERAFALREELKNLPQDDTLVCRCEDVTFERIRRRSGWRDAKLQTRCGMGPCQGRVCGPARSSSCWDGKRNPCARPSSRRASRASAGPNVPNREALGKRVLGIHHVLREARDPGLPREQRHHGRIGPDASLFDQPAGEGGPQNPFVHEILADRQLSLGVQGGHLGACARAAWRAVQGAGPRRGRDQSNAPVDTTTAFLRCASGRDGSPEICAMLMPAMPGLSG